MKEKEAFKLDKEIEEGIIHIDKRALVAKRLLEDPELVAMLGLEIDRDRIEEVVGRFEDQITTLKERRAQLLRDLNASRKTGA